MEPRLIDIFIASARFVLESIGLAPLAVGDTALEKGHRRFGDLISRIDLSGEKTSGNLVVGFESATACGIAAALLGEPQPELNDDVRSVIGEITNMVCGDAKRRLGEIGIVIGMARPELLGDGQPLPPPVGDEGVVIFPCSSAVGAFVVSVDFAVLAP
jgi:chemotaxis protein CheX